MNNFAVRTLSGAVMTVIIIAAVLVSSYTLLALCAAIAVGSMLEFYRLAPGGKDVNRLLPVAAGMYLLIMSFLAVRGIVEGKWLLTALPLVFTIFFVELYRDKSDPLANTAVSLAGILYVAVPMSLLLCMGVTSRMYVLFYMVLIWINDVGAYLVGTMAGKHRLFERISPKKSWEGFFGGVILAFAAALAIARFYDGNYALWITTGIVLPLTAVAGDLVESMFKRAAGIKDSGTAIPGHGGFLDRFDAVLFSIPFVYVIVKFLG